MAPADPRADDDFDDDDNDFDNNDDDELNDDDLDDEGSSSGSGNGGGGGVPAPGDAAAGAGDAKVASPTIASSQPPVALPAATEQLAITSTTPSHGLPTGVVIFLGVAGGLLALFLIFALITFLLRRRWRKEALNPDRREIIYEAPDYNGADDEGGHAAQWADRPSEESAFKDGASSVTIVPSGAHSRKSSQASQKDYLKTKRQRDSLGSYHSPGIAMEEAYTMFGNSRTSVDQIGGDGDGKSHSRNSSDGASILDTKPRRASLLDEQSRYPSLSVSPQTNRRLLRHSVSYTGSADPFSDSTTPPLRRTQTNEEAPSPGNTSPTEGKRISLRNGVGVRARTPVPQSPPAVVAAN